MSETKFTPGPWIVGFKDGWRCVRATHEKGPSICGPGGLNNEANWDLIAAAPDLYAALEGVIRVADRNTVEFDAAKAALAKARGEVPA